MLYWWMKNIQNVQDRTNTKKIREIFISWRSNSCPLGDLKVDVSTPVVPVIQPTEDAKEEIVTIFKLIEIYCTPFKFGQFWFYSLMFESFDPLPLRLGSLGF